MCGVRTLLSRSGFGTIGSLCCRSTSYSSIDISRCLSHYSPIASQICSSNKVETSPLMHIGRTMEKVPFSSLSHGRFYRPDSSLASSIRSSKGILFKGKLHHQHNVFPFCVSPIFHNRGYSSHAGSQQSGLQNGAEVPKVPSAESATNGTTDLVTDDWTDALNNLYQSAKDSTVIAEQKAKEVFDTVVPYIKDLYDSQPYMQQVIVPIGGTMFGTLIAWMILPRILRKFHKYTTPNPLALLSGSPTKEQVPYEKSVWGAVEDPARYLVTFMAFSQLFIPAGGKSQASQA